MAFSLGFCKLVESGSRNLAIPEGCIYLARDGSQARVTVLLLAIRASHIIATVLMNIALGHLLSACMLTAGEGRQVKVPVPAPGNSHGL